MRKNGSIDKCYCFFLLRSISCLESKWHWGSFNPSKWKLNKTRAAQNHRSEIEKKKHLAVRVASAASYASWGFIMINSENLWRKAQKIAWINPYPHIFPAGDFTQGSSDWLTTKHPRHCLDLAHRDPVQASNRQDGLMEFGVSDFQRSPLICEMNIIYIYTYNIQTYM